MGFNGIVWRDFRVTGSGVFSYNEGGVRGYPRHILKTIMKRSSSLKLSARDNQQDGTDQLL